MMKDFDSRENVMTQPVILDFHKGEFSLKRRINATRADLVERGGGERYWKFYEAIIWEYTGEGDLASMKQPGEPIEVAMEEDLEKFLSHRKKPEEMSYGELSEFIRILDKRGERVSDLVTELNLKLSFPLSSIIITLMAFPFAIRTRARNVVMAFAYGVVFAIIYYAAVAFGQALGHQFILPGFIAAWGPSVLFLVLGIYFLYNSSRV